tara:strand:+ start:89232 stop:90875 length:1644 start_codon:yes stop_codon:yes gene_type:complete
MSCFNLATLGVILFFTSTSMAFDQFSQNYHPESPLALGKGASRAYPLRDYRRCLKNSKAKPLDGLGSVTAKIETFRVTSHQELSRHTSISLGVSARLKFLKGIEPGVNGKVGQGVTFSQDSAVFVVKAHANYGRYELDNYDLDPRFQKFLDSGYEKNFLEMCGTHIVIRETREAMAMAIIEISGLSEAHKRTLSAGLSVSAPVGPATVNVKTSVDQILSAKQQTGEIKVRFYARGGAGLSALTGLSTAASIDEFEEGLRQYLSSVTLDTTVPSKYTLASIDFVGGPRPDELPQIEKDVEEFYFDYMNAIDLAEQVRVHMEQNVGLMDAHYMQSLIEVYKQLDDRAEMVHDHIVDLLEFKNPQKLVLNPLPEVNFRTFLPDIQMKSFQLNCLKPDFFALDCGRSMGWLSGMTYWRSELAINLDMTRPYFIKRIRMAMTDPMEGEFILGEITFNREQMDDLKNRVEAQIEQALNEQEAAKLQNQPYDMGNRSLNEFSDDHQQELYKKVRRSRNRFMLYVELVNDLEYTVPLQKPVLSGDHVDLTFEGTF